MTNREVRYCTTQDGVRIGYCVDGNGPTTIIALQAFNESFSLDHMVPAYQQFYRDLGVNRRIIRYDSRGGGLSDVVPEFPHDVLVIDLEAVALSAGEDKYVIWAPGTSGPEAIQFVVRNPNLVSHLILCGTYAADSDALSEDVLGGLKDLAKGNWAMATQTIADMNGRREFPDEAAELGEWYRLSGSAETFLSVMHSAHHDSRPLLPRVQTPTLVLHRINDPAIPFSAGQKLAAGIPNARFVPLREKGHLFCLGDYQPILAAVDWFLGDREQAQLTHTGTQSTSGFRTVLITDIEGSTALTQRLGDAKARDVLREHERMVREALKAHGGSELKTMGDGFMASFSSAARALECAIAMQRAFAAHNESAEEAILVRVGMNAGEPIAEDEDLFGTAVIRAARIAGEAKGGEILVSNVVRELAEGKQFLFADRGEVALKGFDEPVRLYEVRWQE